MGKKIFEKIKEAVKQELGEGYDVFLQKVDKNNGTVRQAVCIRERGQAVVGNVNIDGMVEELKAGDACFQEVVDRIVRRYWDGWYTENLPKVLEFFNRESILGGVVYRLVNKEKNRKLLLDVPYKETLDLAATYRVIADENENGTATFIVSNGVCERYGISMEELDAAAMENTKRRGFQALAVASELEKMGAPQEVIQSGPENLMYVLTNKCFSEGASVMLYPEELDKTAGILDDDLYLLPASIHEVIAVPASAGEPGELGKVVSAVNAKEVSSEDFLSGSVYRYSRKERKLGFA